MPGFVPARALGTELRTLFEQMDADVGRALADLGLDGYRPRFSPLVGCSPRARPASASWRLRPA